MTRRLTTEEFIQKAKSVHGDRYDYSLTRYETALAKVKIICPEHGEFIQRASEHTNKGKGCPECGKISSIKSRIHTKEKCVEIFKKVHGDCYDYSKMVKY